MRIVIDLQGAQGQSRFRGIGRYSLAIALAIARNRGNNEVIIVLNGLLTEGIDSIRKSFSEVLPAENIRVWFSAGPLHATDTENTWRRLTAEFIREAFLASLKPDIVLITSLFEGFGDDAVHSITLGPNRIPTAVISYDLIPLMQSATYLEPNPLYKSFYTRSIEFLKKADLYLAISNSSGRELTDYLGIETKRIFNIMASADDCFKPITLDDSVSEKLRRKFGLVKPFIMYSGATDARKNHLRLIKAFSLLPEEIAKNYQLAIVGRITEENRIKFRNYAEMHDLTSIDVVLTSEVSDEELVQLYNLAELFVFPSWHEGFGLPALEAMSCGTPTIGANTTSIPEVIGHKDALFDPFNAFAISEKIAEVLTNQVLRDELAQHGLEQAKLFSWDNSAQIAISALESNYAENTHNLHVKQSATKYTEWLVKKIISIPAQSKTLDERDLLVTAEAIAQNHLEVGRPQLLVDISELVVRDSKTGIQRVVRSIITELLVSPPKGYDVALVYADYHGNGYRYAKKFTQQFLSKPVSDFSDEIVKISSQDVFLGLDLSHHVVLTHRAFYQRLRMLGAKVYFVVYDLLPILQPEFFPLELPSIHAQWMTELSNSDGLLCISRAVADEAVDWLDIYGLKKTHPLNIGWFHLGADLENSSPSSGLPDNADEILSVLSKFPTFLMVGTVEPRKRQLQALLAFERLWSQGYKVNLVIVGKHGWSVDSLVEMLNEHPERNRHLFWLSHTSDEFLEKVYSASSCLIAASAGEGFGLPLIEAAQHKIPIIARDIPVFREIAGNHAVYFEGNSAGSLADCIIKWLNIETPPSSIGMPWITWKQSKEQLIDVILKDNWYCQWTRDSSIRLLGNDSRLHSIVGKRLAHSIETTGERGYLLFGPYIELDEGGYKVSLHWQSGAEISDDTYVNITMGKGQSVIVRKQLKEVTVSDSMALLIIQVPLECKDFEVCVWVDEITKLEILRIDIENFDTSLDKDNVVYVEEYPNLSEKKLSSNLALDKQEELDIYHRFLNFLKFLIGLILGSKSNRKV